MTQLAKWISFLMAALFASAALAQYPQPRAGVIFSQPELDQMLAPIALYPDTLLSQVLMAATYPRDVAEAASWSRYQHGLRGDEAVRAAEDNRWDPSVLSLVAFPQMLAMLDERREWSARLGDAFIDQPEDVMDTVQDLRRRADAVGSLRSSGEFVVQRQGSYYLIDSPAPDILYVPYYDPRVAYGAWWWPDYAPVYWAPWPGYRFSYGFRGLCWGPGISLGNGFFFGRFDWPRRDLRYASYRPWYFHGRDFRAGARWTPRPDGSRDTVTRAGDRNTNPPRWRGGEARADRNILRPAVASPGTPQRGFFVAQPETVRSSTPAPGNPVVRQASPRYSVDGVRPQGRVPREVAAPQYPVNGGERFVPQRQWVPAQTAAVARQHSGPAAPQVQQRAAPAQLQAARERSPEGRSESAVSRSEGARAVRDR